MTGYIVVLLLGFIVGMVVGIALKVWVDAADAEERARREARRLHPSYDWRDGLRSGECNGGVVRGCNGGSAPRFVPDEVVR